MSPKEIHDDFIKTHKHESSYSTMKNLAVEFKRENGSVEDYERSMRPKKATTDE